MKRLLAIAALLLAACTSAPAQKPDEPATIEVMILGTYHMGNPGADLTNAQIDPVTTPEKQAELEAVATALAKFHPTAIAVERIAADPATMLDQKYPDFKPADLAANPDERVQIGYRLAARTGLSRVYAIDEQDRPGEPSYFPFEAVAAWAERNGRAGELGAVMGSIQGEMTKLEAAQKTRSVGQLLADINAADSPIGEGGHAIYLKMLSFGSGTDQPGAVLNGRWYTRNAMIFAKLRQVAKPGDRILVIYGAGHSYWLRELVRTTPGYRLIDPRNYLPR
ncbi:MAG: DUF5694 domain-containing protein [Hyphomonadaceae bacterium]